MHGWFMTISFDRMGEMLILCHYSSQISLNLAGASPKKKKKNYQQYHSIVNIPSKEVPCFCNITFYAQPPSKEVAVPCSSL